MSSGRLLKIEADSKYLEHRGDTSGYNPCHEYHRSHRLKDDHLFLIEKVL